MKALLRAILFCFFFFVVRATNLNAGEELLSNRGFEQGASSSWNRNGDADIFDGSYPHLPGAWYGYLGNANNAIGSIHQFITIPANATSATLTFYLNIVTFESDAALDDDQMDVNFRHGTTDALLKKWKTYSEADKGDNVAGRYVLKTISFTSADLQPYKGTTVLLQFYAATDFGDSTIFRIDDVSFMVTVDDTPSPPSFFESAGYEDHIDLAWADNSNNETGFRIERQVNGGGFSLLANVGADTTFYTDNSATGCNVYSYRVRAYNGSGDSAYADGPVNFLRPSAPSHLTATVNGNAIVLAWQDNACNESSLRLERKAGVDGAWIQFGDFAPNSVGVTDDSTSSGVTYFYRVYAHNGSGNSGYSGEVSVTRGTTYIVTVSAETNGHVTPEGAVTVVAGGNLTLSAAPDANYVVASWLLDGVVAQNGGDTYTLSAVASAHTVSVSFAAALLRLDIGGSIDDIQVFVDGKPVTPAPFFDLAYGTQVTVRKNLLSIFQFVDHWTLLNANGTQFVSGMAVTTPMLSATTLQAIIGSRNPPPKTRGTISGDTPVIEVPPAGTTSTEVRRHVRRSHDLVCWHDYDLDPTTAQVAVSSGPCSFGEMDNGNAFFKTEFDVAVHAVPLLMFPIPGRSATSMPVTALLDHCNEDSLRLFPADSSPNSSWYTNGLVGAFTKDSMFMTYRGEVLCSDNSTVTFDETLPHFTIDNPLSRPLELNYAAGKVIAYSGHPGYDYADPTLGTNVPVVAAETGRVIPSLSGSYENRIFIEHEELGLATAYLHMKKWSKEVFDHNDTNANSALFYHAKNVEVKKGQTLGLMGGAGYDKAKNQMKLDRFGRHLHFELYRVTIVDGKKTYVLMDPYGAYTATGKQAYGTSWLSSETPPVVYNAGDYLP